MFVSKADITKMAIETNAGFAAVYAEIRELRDEVKTLKELAGVSSKKASSTKNKDSQENT